MSSKLARQALDQLLQTTSSNNKNKNNITKHKVEKAQPIKRLPDTKNGLKKIKYELRYGQHKRLKMERTEQKKKENPIGNASVFERKELLWVGWLFCSPNWCRWLGIKGRSRQEETWTNNLSIIFQMEVIQYRTNDLWKGKVAIELEKEVKVTDWPLYPS